MNKDFKKITRITLLTVFFLFIAVFAFINSRNLIFGVRIKGVSINGTPIVDGSKVTNNIVEMTGYAKHAINVSINGREISIDRYGDFDENIILLSGYNTITITAKDKFGNVDQKNYQLIY